jgi:DNA polymerase V
VYCEQIALQVEFKDGTAAARRANLSSATADYGQIVSAVLQLWKQIWNGQTLSYMHVLAERLSSRRCFQRGLFDQPTKQQQAVADAKRKINERIGRFALRSAATLPLVQLYGDRANNYEVCDIHGKTCF